MARVKFLKQFGAPQAPPERSTSIFFSIAAKGGVSHRPEWGAYIFIFIFQMGAEGTPKAAPKTPLPRWAREFPLKAGVSRVLNDSVSPKMVIKMYIIFSRFFSKV